MEGKHGDNHSEDAEDKTDKEGDMARKESGNDGSALPEEPVMPTRAEMEELGARIALEFDPRLADVWLEVFASEWDPELFSQLGWYLRMAYLSGFRDGATDPKPGKMFARLGMEAPPGLTDLDGGRQRPSIDENEGSEGGSK
jgi:hypothetical protein